MQWSPEVDYVTFCRADSIPPETTSTDPADLAAALANATTVCGTITGCSSAPGSGSCTIQGDPDPVSNPISTNIVFQNVPPYYEQPLWIPVGAPAGFFARLAVLLLAIMAWCLAFYLLGTSVVLPPWFVTHQYTIAATLGAATAAVFYRLRRPKPPKTSFYQPVRIRQADVRFAGVMGGPGQVVFLKLAFTNPEYLNVFLDANREVRERRDQLRHPNHPVPQLLAERPNQLWSWDITKLLGPAKWNYFYLYVILDVFSRYVVGWMVATRESATLAKKLIAETCALTTFQPRSGKRTHVWL